MALDWKSVEQTQTFVKEGVDIILEQGLAGWGSVKQQLEEGREGAGLDGPREATVAGWGIIDAFMAGGDDNARGPGDPGSAKAAAGIDGFVGSLKPGRVGDFVIWSGDPLELSTVAETVYIDGVFAPGSTSPANNRDATSTPASIVS